MINKPPPRRIEPVIGKWAIIAVISVAHIVHKKYEISEDATKTMITALVAIWSLTDGVALGHRIQTMKNKIFESKKDGVPNA